MKKIKNKLEKTRDINIFRVRDRFLSETKTRALLSRQVGLQNFPRLSSYEIGKWQGDRVGFPRVGLVNKEIKLIKDTYEFLKTLVDTNRITIEIQRKNSKISVHKNKKNLAKNLGVKEDKISIKNNSYMKGRYIFRVFTQSRVLFKKFQQFSNNIKYLNKKQIAQFLAGYADAEATIDRRNQLVSFSISNKKPNEAKFIKQLLECLLTNIKIRKAGKLELKIEVGKKSLKNFNRKIAVFMKHPEKLNKIKGGFISERDRKYLKFIKKQEKCTPKILAQKFNIHDDSARRIFRMFKREKLLF